MRVPRPFDPEEVEKPQGREYKKHVEREEKPLATEDKRQSEDYHGGEESTESLPDSPNEGSEEQQEEQQNDNSQQSQSNDESSTSNSQQSSNREQSQQSDGNQSSAGSSSENQDSSDKQSGENSSQGESQQSQSQQSGSNESVNESSTVNTSEQPNSENKQGSSGTESSESGDSHQSSSEQSENQSSSQADDSEESNNEQESDSTSQESNGETSNDSSNDSSDVSEESDASDDANNTNGQNDETSESEEEEVSDSSEESEVQVNSGTYNTDQVFTYVQAKNNTKLSKALYDFIEYVADETKVFNNLSADYYEPKKLMLRRFQGKSLNSTKSGKVRETIVVLLDNSGSMDWVREHVLDTARALIQRHDAEIYFVPNGYIETQLTKQGEVQVKHENVINKIVSQQLKVLYLGDYDGANTPIELSQKTKVFWLCPESRYRRFRSHDWVSYDESDFRGFFARTYDANEMVQALKRFAGFTQFTRYWYDPHEREVFQDD